MTRDEQALWDAMADEAIDYIKEKGDGRGASRLRQAYYDQMSDRRWNNSEFTKLIDLFFDAWRNIADKWGRSGDREDDVVKRAIPDLIDGHFALSVVSDRQASRDLDDRTYNEMRDIAEDFEDVLRGRGGRGRGGRDERDDRGGRGRDRDRDERGRDRVSGRDVGRTRRDDRTSSRRDERVASSNSWDLIAELKNEHNAPARETREEPRATREERRDPEPRREEPVREMTPEMEPRREHHFEGPDYTKSRPHDDFWMGGEHWQVFNHSEWKLTGDSLDPLTRIPSLYNVKTQIKYFVMDQSGEVREEHVDVNDDNRYLAHEMTSSVAADTRDQHKRGAGLNLTAPTSMVDIDDTIESEQEEGKLARLLNGIKLETITMDKPVPFDSVEGAVFANRALMTAAGAQQRVDLSIKRTPIIASSFEQLDLIEQVYNCVTLTDAAEKLRALKPKFDAAVFETLNKRFSDLVLRTLRFQFQFDSIKTLSFVNDWEKVLGYLTTKQGDEFSAQFAKRAAYITRLACYHIDRESLPVLMADLYEEQEGHKAVPAVIFVDFMAVVSLAATLDELGVGHQLRSMPNGASVTSTGNMSLCASLRALYKQITTAVGDGGKTRLYLTTSDHRLVEVIPYASRAENFILSLV